MTRSNQTEWDFIIVGAGSAGCVLADRLTEDGTTTALLLEAGGSDRHPFILFPAGFLKLKSKYDWLYEAEPDNSVNGTIEKWPAGRVLGGSSSINATTWTRGHRGDFDRWATLGCNGWDFQNVLPYFRRSENFVGGADDYRGAKGPQHVSFSGIHHPLIDAFVHAAEQQGIAYNADLNGANQEGVSFQQVSQHRGLRDSSATSYLAEARRRPNLTVRKNVFVTRVVIENNHAVGVEYRDGEQNVRVHAAREVIVAAGTLASPKLLMLSGIGPADQLHSHGIDVVADVKGVGQNLQDHPVVGFVYEVNTSTLNLELNVRGVVKHGLDFLLHRSGGVTAAGSAAISFAKFDPQHIQPDVEINFRPLAVAKATTMQKSSSGRAGFSDMKPMKIAAVQSSVWWCHPRSRGDVSLVSKDPQRSPRIRHELVGEQSDIEGLTKGCKLLREIFEQDAFRPYVVGELRPGTKTTTDEQWETYIRSNARHGHHPVGTCKMGNDDLSVVDAELRVRGVDGLRVVDASVMPELITGHTNAATIMIAERAADLIRGKMTRMS